MAMAMAMAMLMATAMIDCHLLHDSNEIITAIIYFSFLYLCEGKFVGDKGNGRRERNSGLVFAMATAMATATTMATVTVQDRGDGFFSVNCFHQWN